MAYDIRKRVNKFPQKTLGGCLVYAICSIIDNGDLIELMDNPSKSHSEHELAVFLDKHTSLQLQCHSRHPRGLDESVFTNDLLSGFSPLLPIGWGIPFIFIIETLPGTYHAVLIYVFKLYDHRFACYYLDPKNPYWSIVPTLNTFNGKKVIGVYTLFDGDAGNIIGEEWERFKKS